MTWVLLFEYHRLKDGEAFRMCQLHRLDVVGVYELLSELGHLFFDVLVLVAAMVGSKVFHLTLPTIVLDSVR